MCEATLRDRYNRIYIYIYIGRRESGSDFLGSIPAIEGEIEREREGSKWRVMSRVCYTHIMPGPGQPTPCYLPLAASILRTPFPLSGLVHVVLYIDEPSRVYNYIGVIVNPRETWLPASGTPILRLLLSFKRFGKFALRFCVLSNIVFFSTKD